MKKLVNVDSIIQLEDLFGTNWNIYEETGNSISEFQFFKNISYLHCLI